MLHAFSGPDGMYPSGRLTRDAAGALYGETLYGGADASGTVFKLMPPSQGLPAWTRSTIFDFGRFGGNGPYPNGGLAMDSKGALYGEAYGRATSCSSCTTIFKLSPPPAGKTVWTFDALYVFSGAKYGNWSTGAVIVDATGAVYGTTKFGGITGATCPVAGCGTIYRLSPPAPGQTVWTESVLYRFTGTMGDGHEPTGGLTLDATGSLFGTTGFGGAREGGTVFKLSPPVAGQTSWSESVLHSFARSGDPDGARPSTGVALGSGGVLYGTALLGGERDPKYCREGCGTVFRLTRPSQGNGGWAISVLYAFDGVSSSLPQSAVTVDPSGSLYGVTYATVFELTPPAFGNGPWTHAVLRVLDDLTWPMLEDANGNLYGTTEYGGNTSGCGNGGCGTIFELIK